MWQKDFLTIIDGQHYDEMKSVTLLNGDANLPVFIENYLYFMNEFRRCRKGLKYDSLTSDWSGDEGVLTMTTSKPFYTHGTIEITYKKGTIRFAQLQNKMIISIPKGDKNEA